MSALDLQQQVAALAQRVAALEAAPPPRRSETATPSYLLVAADGTVSAVFPGGLEIPLDTSQSTADPSIKWTLTPGGVPLANLLAYEVNPGTAALIAKAIGVNNPSILLEAILQDANGAQLANTSLTVEDGAVVVSWNDNAGHTLSRVVMSSTGSSDFLASLQPSFQMYVAAAVAAYYPASGAFAKLPVDTFLGADNSGGGASLANHNFTVRPGQAGVWLFSASALENEALAVGNSYVLSLFVNGVEARRLAFDRAQTAANVTASGAASYRLVVGDVVDVRFGVTSSAAKTAGAGAPYHHFSGIRLSS